MPSMNRKPSVWWCPLMTSHTLLPQCLLTQRNRLRIRFQSGMPPRSRSQLWCMKTTHGCGERRNVSSTHSYCSSLHVHDCEDGTFL